ncbi:hypothetical protein OH491_27550 (plasmid) [Termitidicoccus mucosus]|uniref:hypothetical protein n=1 Tax=Termitidicoccus mucosus TaxID=1184151 RepID=UPI003183D110
MPGFVSVPACEIRRILDLGKLRAIKVEGQGGDKSSWKRLPACNAFRDVMMSLSVCSSFTSARSGQTPARTSRHAMQVKPAYGDEHGCVPEIVSRGAIEPFVIKRAKIADLGFQQGQRAWNAGVHAREHFDGDAAGQVGVVHAQDAAQHIHLEQSAGDSLESTAAMGFLASGLTRICQPRRSASFWARATSPTMSASVLVNGANRSNSGLWSRITSAHKLTAWPPTMRGFDWSPKRSAKAFGSKSGITSDNSRHAGESFWEAESRAFLLNLSRCFEAKLNARGIIATIGAFAFPHLIGERQPLKRTRRGSSGLRRSSVLKYSISRVGLAWTVFMVRLSGFWLLLALNGMLSARNHSRFALVFAGALSWI